MDISQTITSDQLDLLLDLERYVRMFYDNTLTQIDRLHAYTSFRDQFPDQFNRMFKDFTPTDALRVDQDSQVIIFHPWFSGWDHEERRGEFHEIWLRHVHLKGLSTPD